MHWDGHCLKKGIIIKIAENGFGDICMNGVQFNFFFHDIMNKRKQKSKPNNKDLCKIKINVKFHLEKVCQLISNSTNRAYNLK